MRCGNWRRGCPGTPADFGPELTDTSTLGSAAFILGQRIASLSRESRRLRAAGHDARQAARPALTERTARPERPERLPWSPLPECGARPDPPRRVSFETTRGTIPTRGAIFRRLGSATKFLAGTGFTMTGADALALGGPWDHEATIAVLADGFFLCLRVEATAAAEDS